jgi:hypothetical protein
MGTKIKDALAAKLAWVIGSGFTWYRTPDSTGDMWSSLFYIFTKKAGRSDPNEPLIWMAEEGDTYHYHCALRHMRNLLSGATRDLDPVEFLLLEFINLTLETLEVT